MQPLSRNQRPDLLYNISDEHVSCTALATENAFLQILFKCPTFAIACGNATKPSRFSYFWQGAESRAPATQNDVSTSKSGANKWCCVHFDLEMFFAHFRATILNISASKSGPNPSVFNTFDFQMCFAPQRRALFRHLNFQKWPEHCVLCAFGNVLRATTACNFSFLI